MQVSRPRFFPGSSFFEKQIPRPAASEHMQIGAAWVFFHFLLSFTFTGLPVHQRSARSERVKHRLVMEVPAEKSSAEAPAQPPSPRVSHQHLHGGCSKNTKFLDRPTNDDISPLQRLQMLTDSSASTHASSPLFPRRPKLRRVLCFCE